MLSIRSFPLPHSCTNLPAANTQAALLTALGGAQRMLCTESHPQRDTYFLCAWHAQSSIGVKFEQYRRKERKLVC